MRPHVLANEASDVPGGRGTDAAMPPARSFRVTNAVGVPTAPSWSSSRAEGQFDHATGRVAVTFTEERGRRGVTNEWRADFGEVAYRHCLNVVGATPLPLGPPLYGGGVQIAIFDGAGVLHEGTPANYAAWQDLLHTIRGKRPGRLRLSWNRW